MHESAWSLPLTSPSTAQWVDSLRLSSTTLCSTVQSYAFQSCSFSASSTQYWLCLSRLPVLSLCFLAPRYASHLTTTSSQYSSSWLFEALRSWTHAVQLLPVYVTQSTTAPSLRSRWSPNSTSLQTACVVPQAPRLSFLPSSLTLEWSFVTQWRLPSAYLLALRSLVSETLWVPWSQFLVEPALRRNFLGDAWALLQVASTGLKTRSKGWSDVSTYEEDQWETRCFHSTLQDRSNRLSWQSQQAMSWKSILLVLLRQATG